MKLSVAGAEGGGEGLAAAMPAPAPAVIWITALQEIPGAGPLGA